MLIQLWLRIVIVTDIDSISISVVFAEEDAWGQYAAAVEV